MRVLLGCLILGLSMSVFGNSYDDAVKARCDRTGSEYVAKHGKNFSRYAEICFDKEMESKKALASYDKRIIQRCDGKVKSYSSTLICAKRIMKYKARLDKDRMDEKLYQECQKEHGIRYDEVESCVIRGLASKKCKAKNIPETGDVLKDMRNRVQCHSQEREALLESRGGMITF